MSVSVLILVQRYIMLLLGRRLACWGFPRGHGWCFGTNSRRGAGTIYCDCATLLTVGLQSHADV